MIKTIMINLVIFFSSLLSAQEIDLFVDPRDGQTYKTVKIGNKTWLADNLKYDVGEGCWCYNDSIENCIKYGRLYTWEAAKKSIPPGWKLPKKSDFENLIEEIAKKHNNVLSAILLGGSSQFNILFGGSRKAGILLLDGESPYTGIHLATAFWSRTINSDVPFKEYPAWILMVSDITKKVEISYLGNNFGFSVRCVKE